MDRRRTATSARDRAAGTIVEACPLTASGAPVGGCRGTGPGPGRRRGTRSPLGRSQGKQRMKPRDLRLDIVADAGRLPGTGVPAKAIPRRELVTGLTGTAGCRLVMAGYGKAQVCAQWSRTGGRAVVWINVEARHRDANVLVRAEDRELARGAVPRERQPQVRSGRHCLARSGRAAGDDPLQERAGRRPSQRSCCAPRSWIDSTASFVTWPKDPGAGAVRDPEHRASSRSTAAAARTLDRPVGRARALAPVPGRWSDDRPLHQYAIEVM